VKPYVILVVKKCLSKVYYIIMLEQVNATNLNVSNAAVRKQEITDICSILS